MVVGYDYSNIYGVIRTSTDGSTWTTSILGSTDYLNKVAYLNSMFVTVGSSTIRTSSDGTTWINATSGAAGTLSGAAYGNATYVAVGASGAILTSTDAANWTSSTSGTVDNRSAVAYGNNTFVSVGAGGTILTSTDGTAWTSRFRIHRMISMAQLTGMASSLPWVLRKNADIQPPTRVTAALRGRANMAVSMVILLMLSPLATGPLSP